MHTKFKNNDSLHLNEVIIPPEHYRFQPNRLPQLNHNKLFITVEPTLLDQLNTTLTKRSTTQLHNDLPPSRPPSLNKSTFQSPKHRRSIIETNSKSQKPLMVENVPYKRRLQTSESNPPDVNFPPLPPPKNPPPLVFKQNHESSTERE